MNQKSNTTPAAAKNAKYRLFRSLRYLRFAACLSAMSIILGKYLQIPNPFQQLIRISFENLPILFAGITMGPIIGALVGIVADLVGCLMVGYSINPLITAGAAAVGIVSGLVGYLWIRRPLWLRVGLSVLLAHLTGSVLIKSFGLAAWFLSSWGMGMMELILWRLLTYTLVGTAEAVILGLLLSNRGFAKFFERR